MPQLNTTTNSFLQMQKLNEGTRPETIADSIAERKIMSPRPLRPVNLLNPDNETSQKMWLPKHNELSSLVNQVIIPRARPNIQNLFPIEKPKFLGATEDTSQ